MKNSDINVRVSVIKADVERFQIRLKSNLLACYTIFLTILETAFILILFIVIICELFSKYIHSYCMFLFSETVKL